MKIIAAAIVALLAIGFVGTVAAGPAQGINDKGKTEHLYLFEKDPATWEIVPDGAWGKMSFQADSFVFNGHGLEAGFIYSLVYYPDPWPGTGLMVLGTGTADEFGDVHIAGDFDFTAIPIAGDENAGAKIWLVLSSDVGDGQMAGWNPTEYLFEYQLI
jgi:hypothetical protein